MPLHRSDSHSTHPKVLKAQSTTWACRIWFSSAGVQPYTRTLTTLKGYEFHQVRIRRALVAQQTRFRRAWEDWCQGVHNQLKHVCWPAKHSMFNWYTCTYMYVLYIHMYIHITAQYVHQQDTILPIALIVSVGDGAWPALMESICMTRMAHSNYSQKEQHAPHTGLEVRDQKQDAR